MHYLYLLIFNNNKHFKIGISSNNYNRILNHQKSFNVNLEKSLIFTGSKKDVSIMEKILLTAIKPSAPHLIKEYVNSDGHTEIRDINYFNEALNIIDTNSKYFNLKKNSINLNQLKNNNKKLVRVKKETISYKQKNIDDINDFINAWHGILSNIITTIVKIDDNKYEINLNETSINFENIKRFRKSVSMSFDKSFVPRGYGLESAQGKYEDCYTKIKFNMPDLLEYDYCECDEFDELFLEKYGYICGLIDKLSE